MKALNEWKVEDFMDLPHRSWDAEVEFGSLVILPQKEIHDSGYARMDFAAIGNDGVPFCLLAGGSDVIHLDGVGGFGKNWLEKYGTCPTMRPVVSWSIDCLPCGLLRIFIGRKKMSCGPALSSFELYSE